MTSGDKSFSEDDTLNLKRYTCKIYCLLKYRKDMPRNKSLIYVCMIFMTV